jgi:hypothetical protein
MLTDTAAHDLRHRRPELAGRLFDPAQCAGLFRPGLAARLTARLRPGTLDRALADGADPAERPQLSARAARLTSRRSRTGSAAVVERFVECAERPGAVRRSRVPVRRAAVRANRGELLALAATLRSPDPVYAQGVAELAMMLRDGTGPLYADRHGEALGRALALARMRLRG